MRLSSRYLNVYQSSIRSAILKMLTPQELPCKLFGLFVLPVCCCMSTLFCISWIFSDTEIDWVAYMEEVGGFLNGTLDYQYLKGGTGPLVYPAGFVYIFSIFYFWTDKGTNIVSAQWIFGLLYLALIYQVFKLYCRSKKVNFDTMRNDI